MLRFITISIIILLGINVVTQGQVLPKPTGLTYYFEIRTKGKNASLFPGLAKDLSNVPYVVVHTN
jgi:hypothetical protein